MPNNNVPTVPLPLTHLFGQVAVGMTQNAGHVKEQEEGFRAEPKKARVVDNNNNNDVLESADLAECIIVWWMQMMSMEVFGLVKRGVSNSFENSKFFEIIFYSLFLGIKSSVSVYKDQLADVSGIWALLS